MTNSYRLSKGQALTEYMVAAVFLMIIVWYGLVGGSVDNAGNGGIWEDEDVQATGTYLDEYHPSATSAPGLVQALHKKQEDFVDSIYEP